MKRVFFFCIVSFAAVFGATTVKEGLLPMDEFMASKQIYSQAALDGLMNENFEAIMNAGEKMKVMQADKKWNRITSEEYQRFSQDFEKRAQAMVDAARRGNLDGCMTAYINCLQTCYNCHKYVRSYPYAKASIDLDTDRKSR